MLHIVYTMLLYTKHTDAPRPWPWGTAVTKQRGQSKESPEETAPQHSFQQPKQFFQKHNNATFYK